MTKDDLQTIFVTQLAAGMTSTFVMMYEDNGFGGVKCTTESVLLTDLDTLATTLVDYTFVAADKHPIDMPAFINNACTATIPMVPQTITPVVVRPVVEATPDTTVAADSSTATPTTDTPTPSA